MQASVIALGRNLGHAKFAHQAGNVSDDFCVPSSYSTSRSHDAGRWLGPIIFIGVLMSPLMVILIDAPACFRDSVKAMVESKRTDAHAVPHWTILSFTRRLGRPLSVSDEARAATRWGTCIGLTYENPNIFEISLDPRPSAGMREVRDAGLGHLTATDRRSDCAAEDDWLCFSLVDLPFFFFFSLSASASGPAPRRVSPQMGQMESQLPKGSGQGGLGTS